MVRLTLLPLVSTSMRQSPLPGLEVEVRFAAGFSNPPVQTLLALESGDMLPPSCLDAEDAD
jgi:hypothetical protein